MSSGFVSGGTNEEPAERDEAWLKAQQELDARALARKQAAQGQNDGKSLYETLQANKAAKQEAFEEAARLKNQFRSLDEDEVTFLDEVVQSEKTKEAELKRQQKEQLEAFRQQQLEIERAAKQQQEGGEAQVDPAGAWSTAAKKRKKSKELLGGVKLRRTSTNSKDSPAVERKGNASDAAASVTKENQAAQRTSDSPEVATMPESGPQQDEAVKTSDEQSLTVKSSGPTESSKTATAGLGLVVYSSDEDDD